MTDLLTLTRVHDLPPYWDGHAVLWEGWQVEPPVFLCPPPRPVRCEGCGSRAPSVTNRGLVAVWPSLTHDDLLEEEDNRRRLGSAAHMRKPRARWRLRALRCPDCQLDTVWDIETDEWWTLDHTDYGDEGSARPGGVR